MIFPRKCLSVGISILLAVKEVHDGLEDVVGVLCHTAASTCWHVSCPLHLAKYVSHLLDIFFNVWLETSRWRTDVTPRIKKKWYIKTTSFWSHGTLPGGKYPCKVIQNIVELQLEFFQDVTSFNVQLKGTLSNGQNHQNLARFSEGCRYLLKKQI